MNALAVHPATSGTVYAAVAPVGSYDLGPSTIYKTEDGAASWTPLYEASNQVYALAAAGTNVYAGAFNPNGEGPGIYVSQDSGLNWTPVLTFPNRGVWIDIAVDASDPDVAIAGGWLALTNPRSGRIRDPPGLFQLRPLRFPSLLADP